MAEKNKQRQIRAVKKWSVKRVVRTEPCFLRDYESKIIHGLGDIKAEWNEGDGSTMDLEFINDGEICLEESDRTGDYSLTDVQVTRDLLPAFFK